MYACTFDKNKNKYTWRTVGNTCLYFHTSWNSRFRQNRTVPRESVLSFNHIWKHFNRPKIFYDEINDYLRSSFFFIKKIPTFWWRLLPPVRPPSISLRTTTVGFWWLKYRTTIPFFKTCTRIIVDARCRYRSIIGTVRSMTAAGKRHSSPMTFLGMHYVEVICLCTPLNAAQRDLSNGPWKISALNP